jgi:surface protein
MEEMFQGATAFNQNLSSWNTSAVENMREMFSGAIQFNGAVGAWDTQNVASFYAIFQGASSFNQPLTSWNISLATNVASMFYGATEFNQGVSHMNPLSATDTSRMFLDAGKFNNGGSTCGINEPTRALEWATSAVQNMDRMFEGAICFNQEVKLDTGSVTSMVQMFSDADQFNQPIVPESPWWNLSTVRDMTGMFRGADEFDQPLSSWNTSAVETMNYMFFDAAKFDQGIQSWNVSSVSDARAFHGGNNLASWEPSERPNLTPSAASRRMFLTQNAFTGNLGGIPGADLECNSDPGKPMTGYYRALLVALGQRSVQPASLNWPIAPLVQYTRPDGTRVTTATSGALFGPFVQAISATGGGFWTGMDQAYSQIENCTNWTSSDASVGGVSSASSAITSDETVCEEHRRLLCVEE